MVFPLFPKASTRLFAGRLNTQGPSAIVVTTLSDPVKTVPGTWPARETVTAEVLNASVIGPGTPVTLTDVVRVTVTVPKPISLGETEGPDNVTRAVGAPPSSATPISQAVPILGRLSAYEGRP